MGKQESPIESLQKVLCAAQAAVASQLREIGQTTNLNLAAVNIAEAIEMVQSISEQPKEVSAPPKGKGKGSK